MTPANSLAMRLLAWLLEGPQLVVVLLTAGVVISSLGVIYAAHETRATYGRLQDLQETQDSLDSRYEKLLLEQSAWGGYSRVDQIAHKQLDMSSPKPEDIVVVHK